MNGVIQDDVVASSLTIILPAVSMEIGEVYRCRISYVTLQGDAKKIQILLKVSNYEGNLDIIKK